jgi:hypothetical protein
VLFLGWEGYWAQAVGPEGALLAVVGAPGFKLVHRGLGAPGLGLAGCGLRVGGFWFK